MSLVQKLIIEGQPWQHLRRGSNVLLGTEQRVRGGWGRADRLREAKAPSEAEALVRFFAQLGVVVTRIGLEAGPLSQWLHAGSTKAGLRDRRSARVPAGEGGALGDGGQDRLGGMPGASPSCCGAAGFRRRLVTHHTAQETGFCWLGASSCRAKPLDVELQVFLGILAWLSGLELSAWLARVVFVQLHSRSSRPARKCWSG